ncbi:MAG: hypothetical protein PF439_01315 [Helicobacteraceae bacterium]|nr:hypothetical protein [Helicobacteraceae bacterium]
MKRIIKIYINNKSSVQQYLRDTLTAFHPSNFEKRSLIQFFETEKAAEFIYAVSSGYKQITPGYSRKKSDDTRVGYDKSYYFNGIQFNEDDTYISNPYLHHVTGNPVVTGVKKEGNDFIVIDFDLMQLLEELNFIEHNPLINKTNKFVIGTGGVLLGAVSLFLILYGGFIFISLLWGAPNQDILHAVFQSIISITIGLAIYDLAKHIIEHEILFKSTMHEDSSENAILAKFLNSIIIASSIESLMVIFKIVLDDYSNMINALYLILGVVLLIFARVALVRYGKFDR